MTVLVVDDQIHVVEGILLGVHWEKIGVTRVRKAYTAADARAILQAERVDVLLCDIEMPAESGLDLLRWIRAENRRVKCIFLTAHPDFSYAQASIQLGGFDYILQPARFEEIERSVVRACDEIRREREIDEYYSYGKAVSREKSRILSGVLSDWYSGRQCRFESVRQTLQSFGIPLRAEQGVFFVILQICRWPGGESPWDCDLLLCAVSNILEEVFRQAGQTVLPATLDADSFAFLAYAPQKPPEDEEDLRKRLELLLELLLETLGCGAAFYTCKPFTPPELTPSHVARLRQLRADNVCRTGRVFFAEDARRPDCAIEYSRFEHWSGLLAQGYADAVAREAENYLEELAPRLNAHTLRQFYQAFRQMAETAARELGLPCQSVSEEEAAARRPWQGKGTVEQIRGLMRDTLGCLQRELENSRPSDPADQIGAVVRYILANIESDLPRGEIANAVHLNANYLSGLFKSRMGLSLREYITREKMRTAQTLLKTTRLPVGAVANKVGYSNFSYFSQVYKKCFGILPGEDRKMT